MTPVSSLRNRMILIITLVSLCALVLVVGAARKTGNGRGKQSGTPHMESFTPREQNKTRAFEVTRARRNLDFDTGPELSLRNGYEKNVTAFAVSINGLIVMSDFAYSENEDHRTIAPGMVYISGFGNVRRSINSAVAGREDFDIEILAVLFDDKSSDGNDKGVAFLVGNRQKSKRILTRIIDVLNEGLDPLRTIDDTSTAELRSRISSLSSNPDDASDINDVLRWIDQSDKTLSPSARLVLVKETSERLVARLSSERASGLASKQEISLVLCC